MPRERRRRSGSRESSGPLTRAILPTRTTRRSTVPAFHQPSPKDARNPRANDRDVDPPSTSSTGAVPRPPSLARPPHVLPHVFHPSASTPIARTSSTSMAHTVSNPLPTPTSADPLIPPPLPLVPPLQRDDVDMEGDRGREKSRSARPRRSRKDYESYAGPAPALPYHPYNQYYPGVHSASPSRITLASASAVATAEMATQRTNRFHRSHRFERLPLTPRSRSPITFTFSGEPSEYFALWRGRRVRLPGPLPWPCDSLELERVEAQHWLTRLLLGYPFLGPVTEVLKGKADGRVLDIGTGVGVWAMDVAEMFPWVEVVGCDNVPIQERETCQNVEWDIVDLEDLPYDPSSFDVVHIRFSSLRIASYRLLLQNAWRLVRPGGILLIFDTSSPPILSTGKTPTGAQAWTDAFHRSLQNAGMTPFKVDEVVQLFSNEEIVGNDMRVPIGHGEGRMGQLGKIHVVNTTAFLEAARLVMVEYGGYSDPEVDVLCAAYLADAEKQALYTRYHAFSIRKRAGEEV